MGSVIELNAEPSIQCGLIARFRSLLGHTVKRVFKFYSSQVGTSKLGATLMCPSAGPHCQTCDSRVLVQTGTIRGPSYAVMHTKYYTNLGSRLAGVGVMGGIGLNGDRSEEYLQLVDF